MQSVAPLYSKKAPVDAFKFAGESSSEREKDDDGREEEKVRDERQTDNEDDDSEDDDLDWGDIANEKPLANNKLSTRRQRIQDFFKEVAREEDQNQAQNATS